MTEPEGVTVEDGQKLRHDETWLVLDDGRVRELRLRVGRGVIVDHDGLNGIAWKDDAQVTVWHGSRETIDVKRPRVEITVEAA